MKRRPNNIAQTMAKEREKLIGLGERSISKSYYPELKKRVEELEHFRAMLDRTSDAIFVVDALTGRITDSSGAVKRMLNCSSKELKGRLFKELLPPHVARYSSSFIGSDNEHMNLEAEFVCESEADVPSLPVELSISSIEYHGQRLAIIVARDISERKRSAEALQRNHDLLEKRVEERTRELDRANKAKGEFLSVVSHELRTPLTSVLGFTKIIQKKIDESVFPSITHAEGKVLRDMNNIRNNLDIIISEGNRLTLLINEVLDLAKMEANRLEFERRPISPNIFIEQAVAATDGLFHNLDVDLIVTVEPDMPQVLGDTNRLVQVLVNLFSNAAKFTQKGKITLQAKVKDDTIEISVTDTGLGIPKEMENVIFDKFTQVKNTLEDRPKGTGLGLPICRNIVEGHFGKIWIEPRENGARFVFTLPIMPQANENSITTNFPMS